MAFQASFVTSNISYFKIFPTQAKSNSNHSLKAKGTS
jgi:hypothetical protein